jgi:hypothetical protein
LEGKVNMCTGVIKESDVLLSCVPCDPRRVQVVLADWGLDESTIKRMLNEQEAPDTHRSTRANVSVKSPYPFVEKAL